MFRIIYSVWLLSFLSCSLLSYSSNCFIGISGHHSLFILSFLLFSLNFFNPLFFHRIPWIINQSETEWVMWDAAPVAEHAEGMKRRRGEEIWWARSHRLKQVALTLQSQTEEISNMTENCTALATRAEIRNCFKLDGHVSDRQRIRCSDSNLISCSTFHKDDIFSILHAFPLY
jgi:hypothetical protein